MYLGLHSWTSCTQSRTTGDPPEDIERYLFPDGSPHRELVPVSRGQSRAPTPMDDWVWNQWLKWACAGKWVVCENCAVVPEKLCSTWKCLVFVRVCVSAAVRPGCCRGAAEGEGTRPTGRSSSVERSPAGWRVAGGRWKGSRSRCGTPAARRRCACCLWSPSGGSTASRWGSGCGGSPSPAGPGRRGWWPCRPWRGRCRRCRGSGRAGPPPPPGPRLPQNHSSYSSNTAQEVEEDARKERWGIV